MSQKRRMNNTQRRIRRKKRLLIFEIILVVLLGVVAFGSSYIRHKFNLINHKDLDKSKVITASEVNKDLKNADSLKGKEVIALVGVDTRGAQDGANSDSMIICSIDHDAKKVRMASLYRDTYLNIGKDKYTKSNAAYNTGGPEQMLSMMNLNLDLNINNYISVNFQAVADAIDILGGVDIELNRAEMKNINEINKETSSVTGYPYVELKVPSKEELPDGQYRVTHLDAAQGMTYARIRYTAGNDFRRAARQRILIQKLMEKIKHAGIGELDKVLNKTLTNVTTSLSNTKLISMAYAIIHYEIEDSVGFPFDHIEDTDKKLTGLNCVVPVTLASNVQKLHAFLFDEENYQVSGTVKKYSDHISTKTGLTEADIPSESDDGALPWLKTQSDTSGTSSTSQSGSTGTASSKKTS